MDVKTCSKCKLDKPINEFGRHPQTKDKLQCRCNQCRKIDKKKYYETNKKVINCKSKKYREEKYRRFIR